MRRLTASDDVQLPDGLTPLDALVAQRREVERLAAAGVGLDEIKVVAPYNAQVDRLRAVLPDAVEVGTVDKFQGQQAAVSIYTMATSRPEDAPRGMAFLYSLNRLNVATSRARALAIVVASTRLLDAVPRSPTQLRMANAICAVGTET